MNFNLELEAFTGKKTKKQKIRDTRQSDVTIIPAIQRG